MYIGNGKITNEAGYQFQLYRHDGSMARVDYKGPGQIVNRDGVTYAMIGDVSRSAQLPEYRISDEPTPDSVAWVAGYRHGHAQKRMAVSRNAGEDFLTGWRAAWAEKRPLSWRRCANNHEWRTARKTCPTCRGKATGGQR